MIDMTSRPVRPTSVLQLKELIGKDIGPTEWHDI